MLKNQFHKGQSWKYIKSGELFRTCDDGIHRYSYLHLLEAFLYAKYSIGWIESIS